MKLKNKKEIYIKEIIWIISFVIIVALVIRFYPFFVELNTNKKYVSHIVDIFGNYGPFIMILLHAIQNIILIFPGPIFTITGVYLYGPWVGFITNFIGTSIGSTILFLIARRLGHEKVKKLIDRFSSNKDLKHFEKLVEKDEKYALIISRIVPLIPTEIVTLVCGLTELDTDEFVIINSIFFLPRIILENFFFNEMKSGFHGPMGKIMLFLGFSLVTIYIFRHKFKKLFIKELKNI